MRWAERAKEVCKDETGLGHIRRMIRIAAVEKPYMAILAGERSILIYMGSEVLLNKAYVRKGFGTPGTFGRAILRLEHSFHIPISVILQVLEN